jgi:hypothetical protein
MIWLAIRLVPGEVMVDCRARVDAKFAAPVAFVSALKRAGLIAVVAIWVAVLALLGWWLWE